MSESLLDSYIIACVHGSTNGTNGIAISFKVLPIGRDRW